MKTSPRKSRISRTQLALLCLCFAFTGSPRRAWGQDVSTNRPVVAAKPKLLDWRKVPWPALNYSRSPLNGGAALYTIPDATVGKFSLTMILPGGVYTIPRDKRPALGAYVDLLLEGGTTKRSFEQIQQFTAQNGISLGTSLTPQGFVRLDLSGLSADFDAALKLFTEVLMEPAFRESALEIWKREKTREFESLLDAKSLRDQYMLMTPSRETLVRGKGQYFTTYLDRIKPSVIATVARPELIDFHKSLAVKRNGLVLLAGKYTEKQQAQVKAMVESLPEGDPAQSIVKWLPERSSVSPSEKVKVLVILKPDMQQTSISGSALLSGLGDPNPLEEVQLQIASEVFSSTSGVVGEDRFSGALRRRSGYSYSANAQADDDATWPNTNELSWRFSFQTPTDKSTEGLELAWKTWQDFLKNGITQDEFDVKRLVMINKVMASEITNSSLASLVLESLLNGFTPPATPFEDHLATLEASRSVDDVNQLLKKLSDPNQSRAGFVLMGGLTPDEIDDLEDLKFVDSVEIVHFDRLRSDLLK